MADWDPVGDSAVFIDSVEPGQGTVVASNDGRYVVFTNPGWRLTGHVIAPGEFRIYDTQLRQIVDSVDTRIISDSGDTLHFPVDEIAITPDSKYLIGISGKGWGQIMVYSLEELKIERWVEIPGEHDFKLLLCQSAM